jgi:hypothetical protein
MTALYSRSHNSLNLNTYVENINTCGVWYPVLLRTHAWQARWYGLRSIRGPYDSLEMAQGIKFPLTSIQGSEYPQIVPQIAGYEEVATGMLSPLLPQLVGPLRALKQVEYPLGALRWSTYQVSCPPVNNLQGYTSYFTSHYRTTFPQGLGNR